MGAIPPHAHGRQVPLLSPCPGITQNAKVSVHNGKEEGAPTDQAAPCHGPPGPPDWVP